MYSAMPKPKMILFDYGRTLADEKPFNGIAGTKAILQYATTNTNNRTPEEVQAAADALNQELGRFDPQTQHQLSLEIPSWPFNHFLYESLGIELSLSPQEIETIFWDAASPAVPTPGITHFLDFLSERQIRTGVISNISYCGEVVTHRIRHLLPNHSFEFIIASSEYLFRKPSPKIFNLALTKAKLLPKEVWYVGDQYLCDVVGARNAGLFPVLYTGASSATPFPSFPKDDVLTVTHWKEHQNYL